MIPTFTKVERAVFLLNYNVSTDIMVTVNTFKSLSGFSEIMQKAYSKFKLATGKMDDESCLAWFKEKLRIWVIFVDTAKCEFCKRLCPKCFAKENPDFYNHPKGICFNLNSNGLLTDTKLLNLVEYNCKCTHKTTYSLFKIGQNL